MLRTLHIAVIIPLTLFIRCFMLLKNCIGFRAAADGRLTLKEIQYLPKKYAIMNTMALGSYLSGKGSLLSGFASVHNADTLDRNTKPQYELDRFTTDYLLGKKSDDDALKYINGDVRLKHLLDFVKTKVCFAHGSMWYFKI
jgi:hypothetical protein